MKNWLGYIVAIAITLSACNLTQEVEIDLPAYEGQVVVEVYLIPGQPFSALLTKSFSYFDPFSVEVENFLDDIFEEGATINISYGDQTITLENQLFFNPFSGKLYNYVGNQLVPTDFDGVYNLEIITADGDRITSSTTIPERITIDSITYEKNDPTDTLFRTLTYFQDNPDQSNFYRRILAINNPDSIEFDFTFDDELSDSTTIATGTGFDYVTGDTIISTLLNVTEDYFTFYNSLLGAVDANGNPFAQPSTILSNLEGDSNPLGIFTGFHIVTEQAIIEE